MAVLEAYAPINQAFSEELSHLDIAVDTVPRMRLSRDSAVYSDDIIADGPVPLGRLLPAGVDSHGNPTRARIVIFRQPILARTENHEERVDLLTWTLTSLVASYLNVDPTVIDPNFS